MAFIGLDKIPKLLEMIKQNGGIRTSLYKMFRFDDLKDGELAGKDKYGNKYYENPRYFYARNRWIEYADHYYFDFDGSQIPAEWYGWMHYKTDYTPSEDPGRPKYHWMADHTENLSGTCAAWYPYSTTRKKIHGWRVPGAKKLTCKTKSVCETCED